MNKSDRKELQAGFQGEADRTLRLIASLPAPEGLSERVRDGLHTGASRGSGRVLEWPAAARQGFDWLRGAAAAAIVGVVVGGAWWISATAPVSGGSAVAAPVRVRPAGGFSNAGAMHTPNTLNGPVLKKQESGIRDQGSGTPASKDRSLEPAATKESKN
ncbi:hypothetical protein [Terracidiphilus sp.]|jgi:hypothetical protein|uniref:hypothetical protein n=1 Tax=Terracidiphilus sp. TaxID=1964191 RepID=UPI003C1D94E0